MKLEITIKPQVFNQKVFDSVKGCYLQAVLTKLGYKEVRVMYDEVKIGLDTFSIECEGQDELSGTTLENNFARGVDTIVTLTLKVPPVPPKVTVVNEGVAPYENVSSDLNIHFA